VLGVYLGLQQLESSVLQPRIMGRSVELPGIVIIVGIMAGASVAGILGAYLAVPVMATGRIVFLYVHGKLTEEAENDGSEGAGAVEDDDVAGGGAADVVAVEVAGDVAATAPPPTGSLAGMEDRALKEDPDEAL